jgi:hypothetical protein
MGAIIASQVTVALAPQDRDMLGFAHKISFPYISFGDASVTYPANGIPLPPVGAFGMNKIIKRMRVTGLYGFQFAYDRAHHTLRIFQSGAVAALSAAAVSAGTPAGSNAAPAFTGTEAQLSGDSQAYTPAGTVAAPAFTGSALETHTHDITGEGAAGAFVELGVGATVPTCALLEAEVVGN